MIVENRAVSFIPTNRGETVSNYFRCSSAETGQEDFFPGPLELKSDLLSHLGFK